MGTGEDVRLVGFCGAHCGNCGMFRGRAIAQVAADFKELIAAHGSPNWVANYEGLGFSFDDFQKGVDFFCDEGAWSYCQVPCREGGGAPCCKIRSCGNEKGVRICFECPEYPCELISSLSEKNPRAIEEEKRFRSLGMEKWLELKEEMSKNGYARATGKYYTKARSG